MTLGKAVELLESKGFGVWGTSTVKAAVDGKSKDLRENVLRFVLQDFLSLADSVKHGRAESAEPGVAKFGDRADDQTVEQWKHRAILAEDRLEQLQNNIRAALSLSTAPPVPLSSATDLSEAQEIAKRAGDAHDSHQQK